MGLQGGEGKRSEEHTSELQSLSVIAYAVFGPVFRYFDVFDRIADFGILEATPRVATWRAALAARPSVRDAVDPAYPALLRLFLVQRGSALSAAMKA